MHRWQPVLEGRLPSGPAVLVANHLSYIDPLVVCALTPCLPIAKQEVSSWPFIGAATRALGVQFMRRGDAVAGASTLRRAKATLAEGVQILNFPEGTTTAGAPKPFAPGIFGLARRAGVPVIPLALAFENPDLAWVGDDLLLPHYLEALLAGPSRVLVRVGPALQPASYASARELASAAHAWVSEHCAFELPDAAAWAAAAQ
jgi:1-acyl-sn-glycerol-3-phosphate acyltransferase